LTRLGSPRKKGRKAPKGRIAPSRGQAENRGNVLPSRTGEKQEKGGDYKDDFTARKSKREAREGFRKPGPYSALGGEAEKKKKRDTRKTNKMKREPSGTYII